MRLGSIIEVQWMDANQRDLTLAQIDDMKTSDLLVRQTTYGKLIGKNKDVIILQHEEDNYGIETKDCTVIPRSWIVNPRSLKA